MTGNTTWWGLRLTEGEWEHFRALENSHRALWCPFLVELHDSAESIYPHVGAARAYRNSKEWRKVPTRHPDECPDIAGEIEVP